MSGAGFTNLSSDGQGSLPVLNKPATNSLDAIPGQLQGVARAVVSMAEVRITDLEQHLVTALEHAPNKVFQDTQDVQIRAAKRQLGLAFVGALEKLCSGNRPLEAERWARALRTQFLLGELELLQVDCLNQLAILYFARSQHKRALKAIKAALKLCNRLEHLGVMTAASAATRRAALHLNTSDTLSRLKRHDEALHSANSALQLLEPLADTSVEEKMGAELRISAMHSVGIQRQNTGDVYGASNMLTQALQLATSKLPSDHALRRTVKRNAKAISNPAWDVSMSGTTSSRPPKVLPAIQKAAPKAKANEDVDAKAGVQHLVEQKEQAEQETIATTKAGAAEAAATKTKVEEEEVAAQTQEEAAAASASAAKLKDLEEAAAKVQAEAEAVAAAKMEEERLAADKAEQERLVAEIAAEKAEQERLAAEKSAAKAEEKRLAAEKVEQERLAAEKSAAKAEEKRLAAEKAEQEHLAREAEAQRVQKEAQKRSFEQAAAAAKKEREEAEAKAKAQAEAAAAAKAAEKAAAAEAEHKRQEYEAALKTADATQQAELEADEKVRLEAAEKERYCLEQETKRAEAAAAAAKAAEEASKAKGQLSVTIIECTDLKEMDTGVHAKGTNKLEGWGKKNDAYVICRVSDDVFKRTTTIDEGGENPRWNGGKGEELLFEVDAAETAGRIRFECMDDDSDEIIKKTGEIKEDDFIGAAEMDFKNAPAGRKWKLDDQWIDLEDKNGKASGKLHLIVRWVPPGFARKSSS